MSNTSSAAATTTTRRIYRSNRQLQREANILEVTRTALAEKGYDGVTMQALAAEAGVTKRTLYNLYGGKDELLHAAVSEVIARYRGVEQDAEPGIPSIIFSRRSALEEVTAKPTYSDAMTRALVQVGNEHTLVDSLLRDSVSFSAEHLHTARTNGELCSPLSDDQLARQIVSQGWGMVLMRMKGMLSLQEFTAASLQGLLLLLISSTHGPRRDALNKQFNATIADNGSKTS